MAPHYLGGPRSTMRLSATHATADRSVCSYIAQWAAYVLTGCSLQLQKIHWQIAHWTVLIPCNWRDGTPPHACDADEAKDPTLERHPCPHGRVWLDRADRA